MSQVIENIYPQIDSENIYPQIDSDNKTNIINSRIKKKRGRKPKKILNLFNENIVENINYQFATNNTLVTKFSDNLFINIFNILIDDQLNCKGFITKNGFLINDITLYNNKINNQQDQEKISQLLYKFNNATKYC